MNKSCIHDNRCCVAAAEATTQRSTEELRVQGPTDRLSAAAAATVHRWAELVCSDI